MASSSNSTPSSSSSTISSTTFDEYTQKIQQSALQTTRYAAYMPPDVNFHRSMDAAFSSDLDALSTRILSLTNRLLFFSGSVDVTAASGDKGKAKLQSQDDVVDSFHSLVVDRMDQMLERTDICLDECLGRTKPPAIAVNFTPGTTTKVATKARVSTQRGRLDPVPQHAPHIPKPQLSFKRKIDNSDAPWYPSLAHKYNARVPLGYDYRDSQEPEAESSIQAHPYRYEITHFSPPSRMFVTQTPLPPSPMSSTPFTWISTKEGFQDMLAKLRQASEIAVDLEHNSYRSYAGFVCLMQLSTRQEDWIVDTLELREELVELNEIFTNSDIVKVFHGAESDIIWLQQDFNVYVVNLFDTFHASRLLDFPRHGLANLLEMYCDFVPDKRYQLADWRIRPLSEEMLQYARADTHFLLYIYDCLRNALIDRSLSRPGSKSASPSTTPPVPDGPHLLLTAIARSRETSLRTYQKELYDASSGSGPNGWDALARKWNKPLLFTDNDDSVGKVQRLVYRAVHAWRDRVARDEDESTRYVLPNHYVLQLAERPPNDLPALLNIFPSGPPPVVRRRAKELQDVIRDVLKTISTSQHATDTKRPESAPGLPSGTVGLEKTTTETRSLATAESDIWGTRVRTTAFTTKDSSLFKAVHMGVSTKSSLFHKGLESGSSPTPHFKDVLSRINHALVITPTAPKPVSSKGVEMTLIQSAEADTANAMGMQVEIPFVPVRERKQKVLDTRIEDTIVVVGKAQTKKRKRKVTDKTATEQDASRSLGTAEDGDGEQANVSKKAKSREETKAEVPGDKFREISTRQEDFDFSAVSNILDDNLDHEVEQTSKQKRLKSSKIKGSDVLRGRFTAQPRSQREFSGGNKSYTFKG